VQKVIVSNPAIGSHSYGLTDLGKEQAQKVLMWLSISQEVYILLKKPLVTGAY